MQISESATDMRTIPSTFGLRSAMLLCAAVTLFGVAIASMFEPLFSGSGRQLKFIWLTGYFFRSQDAFWLIGCAALLAACAVLRLPAVASCSLLERPRMRAAILALLAALGVTCGVMGAHVVFHDHHLSRDEILAEHDAVILRSGAIVAPIAPEWRPYSSALAPRFMVPVDRVDGFVSAYLPVNAALRAILGSVLDPAWTSPLLSALAVISIYAVGRRLWPAQPGAALVAAALAATSSQALVGSMTSYAMSGHLALNMLWLWLFLRDDKIGHVGAMSVGALATGLHQAVFHPLFAAPFILRLWTQRRRSLALVYCLAYAAALAVWVGYWQLAALWRGVSPETSEELGAVYFLFRVAEMLLGFEWSGAGLMLDNLLRFVAWQNPLLLPLALLACRQIRAGSGVARELAAGIFLTLVAMFVLLPYQGHGWGYRYLHGLIGNVALLAGYGWVSLAARANAREQGEARALLAVGCAAAVVVLLPAHAMQAERFVAPYAQASAAIARADADVVIVDKSGLLFAEDLIRNDPFLRDRPKILDLTFLDEERLRTLCARYSVALFGKPQALALGIAANADLTRLDDEFRRRNRDVLGKLSCGAELPLAGGR